MSAAIASVEDWKSSIEFTLARHHSEIDTIINRNSKLAEGIVDLVEDIDSLRRHVSEIRESQTAHRVALTINLAILAGLIIAIGFILAR